jgi:uncharacterized sulfatase
MIFALFRPGHASAAEPDTDARPNVLFIISDDLNADLGTYGHPIVKTPNFDRLAARGLRFDRAYAQYPVCNPSRSSFLTGLRPTTTGILDNATHVRENLPDVVTLPQLFRANGYLSVGLGKVFHRGLSPDETRPEMDDPRSFDRVFYGAVTPLGRKGEGRNLTDGRLAWCKWLAAEGTDADQPDGQLTDEAIRTLENDGGRPLFLAVGYYRPHDPFHSPRAYFAKYPLENMIIPVDPPGYVVPNPFAIGGGGFKAAFDRFGPAEKREFLRSYYAGVSFIDAQVGRLLDALDRLDQARRTIVVFIGDHGYELGVRNWWNKNTVFERSCRTPLIIATPTMPDAVRGRATRSLVEFVDLYPTLADLCKLDHAPTNLEGTSLRPVLDDPAGTVKEAATTVVQRGEVLGRSVRTDRFRYTEWGRPAVAVELYDHDRDPGEWTNLADDPDFRKDRDALSRLLPPDVKRKPAPSR